MTLKIALIENNKTVLSVSIQLTTYVFPILEGQTSLLLIDKNSSITQSVCAISNDQDWKRQAIR